MPALPRGTICLVTDGARLVPAGTPAARYAALVSQAAAAAAAGIDFIHLRERHLSARELLVLASEIIMAAAGSRTRVLINDRLDVALAITADGVHLRADSISAADARAIAPRPFVITHAAHSVVEVQQAAIEGAANLVVLGTMFPTPSKPGTHASGLATLRAAAGCAIPILAIGGIDASNVREVAAAGAAGIAAIGWFLTTDADRLAAAASAVRAAFDSMGSVI